MALVSMYMPAVLAVLGALAALTCEMTGRRTWAVAGAVAGAVAAAAWAASSPYVGAPGEPVWSVFGLTIHRGSASLAIAALAGLALVGGWRWFTEAPQGARAASLGALSLAGALVVVAASDLLGLVIGLEWMALAGYALVALGGSDRAREAAMKYFVQGSAATGLLVLGVGLLLIVGDGGGSLRAVVESSASEPGRSPVVLLAWGLVLCVLAFKAGAFPFHSWAPDAYETAPRPAAALLAAVPKVAALVAMVYLFAPESAAADVLPEPLPLGTLAVLAALSIVFGNLVALRQRSFTRMLAYSGIAQVGYAFVGMTSGFGAGVMVFAVLYALGAVGCFIGAEALARLEPAWDGTVAGMAGMARRSPAVSAAIAVCMFSLTGVPLFGGFVGKLALFAPAVIAWPWLVTIGVVGSVVSFGYYGRVLRQLYFADGEAGEADASGESRDPAAVIAIAAAALLVVVGVVGLLPGSAWLALVWMP